MSEKIEYYEIYMEKTQGQSADDVYWESHAYVQKLIEEIERLKDCLVRNINRLVDAGFGSNPNDEPYLLTGAVTLALDEITRLKAERDALKKRVEILEPYCDGCKHIDNIEPCETCRDFSNYKPQEQGE